MEVQPHKVSCVCGNTFESEHKINWCPKCGQKIFDSDKERRAHKANRYYTFVIIALFMSALAYFFLKIIIFPVLSM